MLRASELAEPALARSRANHETYRGVLEQCYAAVHTSNRRGIFFTRSLVPGSMPGRPSFNPAHATAYVRAKLLKGGFSVWNVPPTAQLLHVQWVHAVGKR